MTLTEEKDADIPLLRLWVYFITFKNVSFTALLCEFSSDSFHASGGGMENMKALLKIVTTCWHVPCSLQKTLVAYQLEIIIMIGKF